MARGTVPLLGGVAMLSVALPASCMHRFGDKRSAARIEAGAIGRNDSDGALKADADAFNASGSGVCPCKVKFKIIVEDRFEGEGVHVGPNDFGPNDFGPVDSVEDITNSAESRRLETIQKFPVRVVLDKPVRAGKFTVLTPVLNAYWPSGEPLPMRATHSVYDKRTEYGAIDYQSTSIFDICKPCVWELVQTSWSGLIGLFMWPGLPCDDTIGVTFIDIGVKLFHINNIAFYPGEGINKKYNQVTKGFGGADYLKFDVTGSDPEDKPFMQFEVASGWPKEP